LKRTDKCATREISSMYISRVWPDDLLSVATKAFIVKTILSYQQITLVRLLSTESNLKLIQHNLMDLPRIYNIH